MEQDKIFHITEFDDNSSKKRTRNLYGNYLDKKKFINFLRPTFFDFDLTQIKLSNRHRDFYEIQNKLLTAQAQLRSVKEQLRIAKKQKRYEERAEEWHKQNEELQKLRDAENRQLHDNKTFVNEVKRNYIWGSWTETDEKAAALEEELKKQPKKEAWED